MVKRIVLFSLLLFSGCRMGEREVVIVFRPKPLTLDPHAQKIASVRALLENIYEPLVVYTPSLRIGPCLAEYWETPDDTTWIFHLREDVYFHTGKPFTAYDVKATMERIRGMKGSPYIDNISPIKRMEIKDPYTVVFYLHRPCVTFLNKLATVFIIAEDSLTGTGPYRIEKMKGDTLILSAFEAYREPLEVKRIRIIFFESRPYAAKRFVEGLGDIMYRFPFSYVEEARKKGIKLVHFNPPHIFLLGFNLKRYPVNDPTVRKAAALAIDRKRLALGRGEVVDGYISPNAEGYSPEVHAISYNPSIARRLLKGRRVRFTLLITQDLKSMGEEIKEMLARAGIDVRLELPKDNKEFFHKILGGEVDAFIVLYLNETGDGGDALASLFHTREEGWGGENLFYYSNPRADSLIESVFGVMDRKERNAILLEAQNVILEDLPAIPLFSPFEYHAVRNGYELVPHNAMSLWLKTLRRRR